MDGDDIDLLRLRYPKGEYVLIRAAVTPDDADWLYDQAVWKDLDPSTLIQRAIRHLRVSSVPGNTVHSNLQKDSES